MKYTTTCQQYTCNTKSYINASAFCSSVKYLNSLPSNTVQVYLRVPHFYIIEYCTTRHQIQYQLILHYSIIVCCTALLLSITIRFNTMPSSRFVKLYHRVLYCFINEYFTILSSRAALLNQEILHCFFTELTYTALLSSTVLLYHIKYSIILPLSVVISYYRSVNFSMSLLTVFVVNLNLYINAIIVQEFVSLCRKIHKNS